MKHPLRVFERDKLNTNNPELLYFFNQLMSLYLSRFTWKNLPNEIEPFFIEWALFWSFRGVFFCDEAVNTYAFMRTVLSGEFDIYNFPQNREAWAVNGYSKNLNKKNSVLLMDNFSGVPFCETAYLYAKELADTWKTRSINRFAQRTPLCITSSDEKTLSYKIVGEEYEIGVPIIHVKDDLDLNRIRVLNTQAPYIVDKLDTHMKELQSAYLTELGYNNTNIYKKEKLLNAEINGNNEQVSAQRALPEKLRQRFCENVNRLFGLNIYVEFNNNVNIIDNSTLSNNVSYRDEEVEENEPTHNHN